MNKDLIVECAKHRWNAMADFHTLHGYAGKVHQWDVLPFTIQEQEIAAMRATLEHLALHALGGYFVE